MRCTPLYITILRLSYSATVVRKYDEYWVKLQPEGLPVLPQAAAADAPQIVSVFFNLNNLIGC